MGSPTARGPSHARHSSHGTMLSSGQQKGIDTSEKPVSQLNTQPMVSPVNASRQTSRSAAHHSGPGRLARPYPTKDFHLLSFASLSWRSPLLATSGGSGHLAGTTALPLRADLRAATSAFSPISSALHLGADVHVAPAGLPLLTRSCHSWFSVPAFTPPRSRWISRGIIPDTFVDGADVRGEGPPASHGLGLMFWFSRKRFAGSYIVFKATRRSYLAGP